MELKTCANVWKWFVWSEKHNKHTKSWFRRTFFNPDSNEFLKIPEFRPMNLHEKWVSVKIKKCKHGKGTELSLETYRMKISAFVAKWSGFQWKQYEIPWSSQKSSFKTGSRMRNCIVEFDGDQPEHNPNNSISYI